MALLGTWESKLHTVTHTEPCILLRVPTGTGQGCRREERTQTRSACKPALTTWGKLSPLCISPQSPRRGHPEPGKLGACSAPTAEPAQLLASAPSGGPSCNGLPLHEGEAPSHMQAPLGLMRSLLPCL